MLEKLPPSLCELYLWIYWLSLVIFPYSNCQKVYPISRPHSGHKFLYLFAYPNWQFRRYIMFLCPFTWSIPRISHFQTDPYSKPVLLHGYCKRPMDFVDLPLQSYWKMVSWVHKVTQPVKLLRNHGDVHSIPKLGSTTRGYPLDPIGQLINFSSSARRTPSRWCPRGSDSSPPLWHPWRGWRPPTTSWWTRGGSR